jgi:hypothetical protein
MPPFAGPAGIAPAPASADFAYRQMPFLGPIRRHFRVKFIPETGYIEREFDHTFIR